MRTGEAPEGFHKPIDAKWVLVGDKSSGPIEFEFVTAGAEAADSRVVVCRPDFIARVEFEDPGGVRFSIDGVVTSVVPAESDGISTKSCSVLTAGIAPGRHRLTVEPLRRGEPFVAISHVIYPA